VSHYPNTAVEALEAFNLRNQIERLQVQLAGCLAAAEGATKDVAKCGDYGWSPAYQAVVNLRRQADELKDKSRAYAVLQRVQDEFRDYRLEQARIHETFRELTNCPPDTSLNMHIEKTGRAWEELAELESAQPQEQACCGEQCLCKIKGETFRCECGCTVFTKTSTPEEIDLGIHKYQCNSCEARYLGKA
jgi:type II secretory pathway pseudopilin PulG